jgi:hypothetical protein
MVLRRLTFYEGSDRVLSGAKVLRKLGVDLEIVAVALEIRVLAEIIHLPY